MGGFENKDLEVPSIGCDFLNVPTFKDLLCDFLKGKRVRIHLGHIDNHTFIEGTVEGFENGGGNAGDHEHREVHILLSDIKSNDHWQEYRISSGKYNRHYLRLTDNIKII